jgi:protein adenylyltransferase
MAVASSLFRFEDSYAREVPGLSMPWTAAPAPDPELLVLNQELAAELGVDPAGLREPLGVALLVGQVPEGLRRSPRPTPAISSATTLPASGTAARCCSVR